MNTLPTGQAGFQFHILQAELFFKDFTDRGRGRELQTTKKRKDSHMKSSCIDPPQKRNPRLRPGFQTEPSHNNSDGDSKRDSLITLSGETLKVKPRYPQRVVGSGVKTATDGGKPGVFSAAQQELLNHISPDQQLYGLLLSLHGELQPEHCQNVRVHDDWESEILRRVNKFS